MNKEFTNNSSKFFDEFLSYQLSEQKNRSLQNCFLHLYEFSFSYLQISRKLNNQSNLKERNWHSRFPFCHQCYRSNRQIQILSSIHIQISIVGFLNSPIDDKLQITFTIFVNVNLNTKSKQQLQTRKRRQGIYWRKYLIRSEVLEIHENFFNGILVYKGSLRNFTHTRCVLIVIVIILDTLALWDLELFRSEKNYNNHSFIVSFYSYLVKLACV